MSFEAPTPDLVADQSARLYQDHREIAEELAKSDATASSLVEKLLYQSEEHFDSLTAEAHARETQKQRYDLNINASNAYFGRAWLAINNAEAARLAQDYLPQLREAAITLARFRGYEIKTDDENAFAKAS